MIDNIIKYYKDIDELIKYLSKFITKERYEKICNVATKRTSHFAIVLENLYQGHNASAVLRSCECFGIQNVYVIEDTYKFEPNLDIALGAEKWLDINYFEGFDAVNSCYAKLRSLGYSIAATTPHEKSISIDNVSVKKPMALVFGTEKEGLSSAAIENADFCVSLPMYGFTESFNISVSAALFMQKMIDKVKGLDKNYLVSDIEQKQFIVKWILKTVKDPEGILSRFEK